MTEQKQARNGWMKDSDRYGSRTVYHRQRKNGRVAETITVESIDTGWRITERYAGPSEIQLRDHKIETFDSLLEMRQYLGARLAE